MGNSECITLEWNSLPDLPVRPRNAHKGQFGHVHVVGGDPRMGGALALASRAAYAAGAGLVTAVGHPAARIYLAASLPEAVWWDWPARFAGRLPAGSVLAVGPGLGQGLAAHDMVQEIGQLPFPQVWDADALNILARLGADLLVGTAVRIFTPHPGEAGRLLGVRASMIQEDRAGAIQALRERYGGVWILKGEGTLVLGDTFFGRCPYGNPGMAKGGTGDVLAGLLAGLLALGLEPGAAATLGVCCHARAGDLAARERGENSMLAGDLLDRLPEALQEKSRHCQ